MRYQTIKSLNAIKSLLAFILAVAVTVCSVVFIIPKEGNEKVDILFTTSARLKNLKISDKAYQRITSNGNYLLGNDVCYDDVSGRKYYKFGGDDEFFFVLPDKSRFNFIRDGLGAPFFVIDGYILCPESEDVKLYKANVDNDTTHPEKIIKYNWQEKVTLENGDYNYEYVMELLQKQYNGDIKLIELATLMGTTFRDTLLGYNGDYAVFCKYSSTDDDTWSVTFTKYFNDLKTESYGPYDLNKSCKPLFRNEYVILGNDNKVDVISLKDGSKKEFFTYKEDIVNSVNFAFAENTEILLYSSDDYMYAVKNYTDPETMAKTFSENPLNNTHIFFSSFKGNDVKIEMIDRNNRTTTSYTLTFKEGEANG